MSYKKYKRVFLIVMDSLGIGEMSDAKKYDDEGTNTFLHIDQTRKLNIPTLNALGLYDLEPRLSSCYKVDHPNSFVYKANEASLGKDTMTGHFEMMGIYTVKPFKTFTDTGFPKELIDELSMKTGKKYIGNYSSSGTEILKVLGEQQIEEDSMIIYTSADSVLQLAYNVNKGKAALEELYRCCEVAREICLREEYKVGRVIARPYIGTSKENFKRTSDRHDYALSPEGRTYMDILKDHNYMVSCIGKIADIFNNQGVTKTQKTVSNIDGMNKTIKELNEDYEGLCFVNLVEFDSEYGHRRDPIGYGKAIEDFDKQLKEFISKMNDDDLLIITADHGNDPTHKGTDHTREMVPTIIYSKLIKEGRHLENHNSFADLGRSIIYNFNLEKENQIGEVIKELF